jgi:hypothetical protein
MMDGRWRGVKGREDRKRIIDKGSWMNFTFIPLIKFGEIRKK